jgi:prepilin-type N-terminal cleavage/methylation domain-containing protein
MTDEGTMMTRSSNLPESGFTLVELMVAIAISGIVLASVLSLFIYQQRTYAQQSEMARNQAQVRGALQLLTRDVRMAGYTGIPLGFDREPDLYAVAPWPMTGSTTTLPGSIPSRVDPQYGRSEAIEVWGNFARDTAVLAGDYPAGATIITVRDSDTISGHNKIIFKKFVKRVLIGNANAVSYHEITGATDSTDPNYCTAAAPCTLTINPGLAAPMFNGDLVAPVIRRIYFVANAAEQEGALTTQVGTLFRRTYMVNPAAALSARYGAGNTCVLDEAIADHIDYLNVRYYLSVLDGASVPSIKIDDSPDASGSPTNGPANPCLINSIDLRLVSKTFGPLNAQGQAASAPLILDHSQNVKPRNLGIIRWKCTVAPAPGLSAWTENPCGT